jgi:hypothetical protein
MPLLFGIDLIPMRLHRHQLIQSAEKPIEHRPTLTIHLGAPPAKTFSSMPSFAHNQRSFIRAQKRPSLTQAIGARTITSWGVAT